MLNKKKVEPTLIDKEIESVVEQMQTVEADSDVYNAMLDRLERLHKMKISEKKEKPSVSPDALVAAAASIGGIALILGYEHANVITSKAMSFVFKPKV